MLKVKAMASPEEIFNRTFNTSFMQKSRGAINFDTPNPQRISRMLGSDVDALGAHSRLARDGNAKADQPDHTHHQSVLYRLRRDNHRTELR